MKIMWEEQEPFVSIVTLNFNQTQITCDFLESTRKLEYKNYEILVCDMASDVDPSQQILAGNYPATKVLISRQNLGFAGGNNWGMRQATGDFIFIVNNDTEVTPGLINQLLQPFVLNKSVAVASPKIKFFYAPSVIQYAGFNAINSFTGRSSTIGAMKIDEGQFDVSGPTHAAHGCAMMIKREVMEKVGMFPEIFFLYYEEWDLCARIQRAGYTIWYAAEAIIYHKESMTVGKGNPIKAYYHTRNRILYMRRNTNFFQLSIFSIFFVLFTLPKSLVGYLVNRQYKHLMYFLRGAVWNLKYPSSSVI